MWTDLNIYGWMISNILQFVTDLNHQKLDKVAEDFQLKL